MSAKLTLLTLPLEIRQNIYTHVVANENNRRQLADDRCCFEFDLRLFLVCKQFYHEAREVFWHHNIFVCVETPFADAQHNVVEIGRLPIVAKGNFVDDFGPCQLNCLIDAPEMLHRGEGSKFVIAAEDIEKFCAMWYYFDLTYYERNQGGLNGRLRLTLNIAANPHNEVDQRLPKSVQKQLLMPWGRIKNLHSLLIQGPHDKDLDDAVRESMARPYDSPGHCIEEATRYKDEGNEALKAGDNHRALELYRASFHSIHIVVSGRRRDVWGEGFFDTYVSEGRFKGQHGNLLRTNIRIKLVANTMLAYLNLREYADAYYWGMRSINIMREMFREAADVPRHGSGFLPADVWGKIYYRAALAAKGMNEMGDARELLRIAANWLPTDMIVKQDLIEWGSLRVG